MPGGRLEGKDACNDQTQSVFRSRLLPFIHKCRLDSGSDCSPSKPPAWDEAQAHFLNGNTHYDAGRYQEAIKLFLKAISLKPKYTNALNNLGETYILNKEIENAKRVFQTVLEVDPLDIYAKDNLTKLQTQ